MSKTILITGIAGFIGFNLAQHLSRNTNWSIVGIDNVNDYYDTQLKEDRIKNLDKRVRFFRRDLNDDLSDIFRQESIDCVVNLAAQAGVRYSKKNPGTYIYSNINGFYNLINTARVFGVTKVLYASSSSVYGANEQLPFKESDLTSTPMSLYAATKLSNESMASGFFYSYGIRTIGLRFFNIYGPFGRPDMAYFMWTNKLINSEEISLNNNGDMWRDMTYINDCIKAIHLLLVNNENSATPEIYNIGNKDPIRIGDLLEYIADELGLIPNIKYTLAGSEEPVKTWADTSLLEKKIGFTPNTDFRYGVKKFLDWYEEYYD